MYFRTSCVYLHSVPASVISIFRVCFVALEKIEDQVRELEQKKDEAIQDEDYQQAEAHKYHVFELTVSALQYLRANHFVHFFEVRGNSIAHSFSVICIPKLNRENESK